MDMIVAEIAAFLGSDALPCPAMGQGFVQCYGANVLAHIAIAMLASVAVFLLGWSYRWLFAPFAFLVAKELFFDLPMGGVGFVVALDSGIDVLSYLMGAAVIFWAIMSEDVK